MSPFTCRSGVTHKSGPPPNETLLRCESPRGRACTTGPAEEGLLLAFGEAMF